MKAIAMCLTHDVGNIASGEVTLVLEQHQSTAGSRRNLRPRS